MRRYGPRLYGYFYRATGHHHDAEDLLGEMTLKLVRQLEKYDDRGRFEPWLFRIAANMVRDRIRRLKVRPRNVSLSVEDASGRKLSDRLGADDQHVDVNLLAETSRLSGVNIIVCAGWWLDIPPFFAGISADQFADLFTREV